MSRSAPPVNRFFVNPQYSLFYRRAKTLVWQEQVRPEHVILFVLEGTLEVETEKQPSRIDSRTVLLFEPLRPFTAVGRDIEVLLLTLSAQFLVDYAVRMQLVGPTANISFSTHKLEQERRLGELGENLTKELTAADAGREIVIAAAVEQIVVHLLRNFCNMKRSNELEISRVGLIDRRIRRAVELMHSQLDRELSLKEIAEASHLSPFHFARLFKKLTGASPHAYLANLRAKQAQLLLAETDLSVTEISARVGYASPSHFTQAFRQVTGLTPKAFRSAVVTRD